MSSTEEKFNRRRLRTSYISSVFSITLVLFMLGLLGMILLHAGKLSNMVKENIIVTVMLKESVKDADMMELQKTLDASNYVKETQLISPEKAADIMKKDLGQDFISVLGFNPLPYSIDVKVNADYANADSLKRIEKKLLDNESVREVSYPPSVLKNVNENIQKISIFLVFFSVVLLFVALALINSTIRLAVYSKRLLIKSMQLVGATPGFIRKPFIITGIIQGSIAGVVSILFLFISLLYLKSKLPELNDLQDPNTTILVFVGLIVFGVLISSLSTIFAVRKYLRIRSIDLF